MKKKIVWLVVSCPMALSLVMASCGPAAEEEVEIGEAEVVIEEEEEEAEEEVVEEEEGLLPPEVPKYGGTITIATTADPTSFDGCEGGSGGGQASFYVYEQHMQLDWTRGPAGSGVTDFTSGGGALEDFQGSQVAESWEMPEPGLWILQIRQGMHWQQVDSEAGRLMAGRELTADDVVYSFNRHKESPLSWLNVSQPPVAKSVTIEKTGPWEVTIRTPVEHWTSFLWVIYGAGSGRIYPREVVERYGNVEDWRNSVGTGPFIFADYVPSSLLTFVKNPTYWGTDPVGPGKGNQLPYVDRVREMIIPDLSTRLAALRSGKLDMMAGIVFEHWQNLRATNPELEYHRTLPNLPYVIGMRQDKPELAFHDVRVRQALMLATDLETIVRDYYGGEAEIDVFPVNRNISALYTPLEEMPEAVQELFTYNPEKAKQLLAEAGYPDGFKAKVITSPDAERIDELAIFQDMWSKIGVELEIDIRETGAYFRIGGRRTHEEMIYRILFQTFSIQLFFSGHRGTSTFNTSYINDPPGTVPYLEELYWDVQEYIFSDTPRAYEAYKNLKPYLLEQAYYIVRPTPYTYTMWWPWLQNFYGQGTGFVRYFWIDTALKESMGY